MRAAAAAPADDSRTEQSSLVTKVHGTGFVQLTADSFNDLTQTQKMDAYWLYRAAVAIGPIAYDQNSADGLREKHLLEAILTHANGIDPVVLKKITDYTMLFWGNKGNHNTNTSVKILPDFTSAELRAAAEQASKNGAALGSAAGLARELQELDKPIFDPAFEPMLVDEESEERRGSAGGRQREFLFRRHAEGSGRVHRALRAEFAADQAGWQARGRCLSHGHAGRHGAAGTIRARAWIGDSKPAAGAALFSRRSRRR